MSDNSFAQLIRSQILTISRPIIFFGDTFEEQNIFEI